MSDPRHAIAIHYSCESFYDRPEGTSPRITSIACQNIETGDSSSFSVHLIAEQKGYPVAEIPDHYDELERDMLAVFYEYARRHSGHNWIHWNMRNVHYGFDALAHRFRVLGGEPHGIPDSARINLSRLLYAIYGPEYIGHPRLTKLVEKNDISVKDFLSGEGEAAAFEEGNYVALHYSTLRKVDILSTIARRADEDSLLTDATWRDTYGLWPQAIVEWFNENWIVRLVELLFAAVGFAVTIAEVWKLLNP